jgi:hypothetical protein
MDASNCHIIHFILCNITSGFKTPAEFTDETSWKWPFTTLRNWDNNVKIDIMEVGCESINLIQGAQGRMQWTALLG